MVLSAVSSSTKLPFFSAHIAITQNSDGIWAAPIQTSPAIEANSVYFGHPEWAKGYFDSCHRDQVFRERWLSVMGSWDDKVVVDIGCGPGNLYASIGGSPRTIIGVDVAEGGLKMAAQIGYTPVLADAHDLPFVSEFADIVALNATLHHCEDMPTVLAEAARLVKPGGLLIVDHDPQRSAWNYQGLALMFYKMRLPIYRFFLRNLHIDSEERLTALKTEIHHRPGDGVTAEFFTQTLQPKGFQVNLFPHNQTVGADILKGVQGEFPHWRYGLGQRLSGIDSRSPEAALSLLVVAQKSQQD
ncbi:class I SAM-dependent methyltransferase [Acaryochloris sp. CCMEE 5410]|uniref:class I SAM-dependent methyltransferase n=1 Tax=Acaryochloris sp. CCMEE 5410 TaxID=310037 RepID=UPI00024851C6|nr:class I SAM-dependent methyltransferase [Acaryochloris sp. CCMEE 5410]KAI9133687.1 methyltransferase domain-containing protein [Acaryochloris sp. CCMEE 5410]